MSVMRFAAGGYVIAIDIIATLYIHQAYTQPHIFRYCIGIRHNKVVPIDFSFAIAKGQDKYIVVIAFAASPHIIWTAG